ncbi:hypothetical protein M409DRAFT_16071 [Zasmidium cellare ATCC 36951]|uniref:RRM domain-containing protein n=1 Tax=Zasmidium cellare ATCC 36951 TaxID=1080233 RepID=A0A6A6D635_ZASCE|nr:uncharacterized protein M409DRAFT_16071 [Zasmidium cellare ATCC 36951]KAF2173800.1 hypothetical protein M409DRAFT_16071 [Zasmidium cellare ATCC 36951]
MAHQGKENSAGGSSEQSMSNSGYQPHTNYYGAETADPAHHYSTYPQGYTTDYAQNSYYGSFPSNYYTATNQAAPAYYPNYYDQSGYNSYGTNSGYQAYQHQAMAYNNSYANSGYGAGYGYPPGYNAQYAQPQQQQYQQYQASPPQIRNPFAPPPPPTTTYGAQNANFDPEYEQQIAEWQSAYAPADQQERGKKSGKFDRLDNANAAPIGQRGTVATGTDSSDAKGKGANDNVTVVRKGGGQTWEDKSLLEWDPTKFRIMVGNLAGEVTDDLLSKAFDKYDVSKARVVRDKRTTKSKGFGFVEFNDSELGFKAAREMSQKYIGSHPITIKRSTANVAPVVKKDNNKGKNNDKKNKKNKDEKDPLRANTQAGIDKKQPSRAPSGLKLLG